MRNKIILTSLFLSFNLYAASSSFKDIPTSFLKENKIAQVQFERKAAVYKYQKNKKCDDILSKAIQDKKEITVTIDAKINKILKCEIDK